MVKTCLVSGCNSEWYPGCSLKFRRFPKNIIRRNTWLSILPLKGKYYESATICSLHFSPEDYEFHGNRLKQDAQPKHFDPNDTITMTSNPQEGILQELNLELPSTSKLSPQSNRVDPYLRKRKQSMPPDTSPSKKSCSLEEYTEEESCGVQTFDPLLRKRKQPMPPDTSPSKKSCTLEEAIEGESCDVQLAAPESSNQPKRKSQPKQKPYDPFKAYASDSTDDENTDIKEGASDENSGDDETEDGTPKTEKVFVTSMSCKGKQSIDGRSQPKRSRLDPEENLDAYEEELYEFGKYVAEQLLCLDIEDARVARMDISAVLSQFAPKRIREPSIFKEKRKKGVQTVAQTVSSMSQVQVATQPQFVFVNTAGPSNIPMNISEPSVSQQVNIPGPSASQIPQVNIGPVKTEAIAAPALNRYSVMNVSQSSSPGAAPLGYIVVPALGPRFDTGEHGNAEAISITTGTISSVGSITTQSSNVVSAGPAVTQTTSSINFDEVAVKIEPNSEDAVQSTYSHVDVFGSDGHESLVYKYEQQSDDET